VGLGPAMGTLPRIAPYPSHERGRIDEGTLYEVATRGDGGKGRKPEPDDMITTTTRSPPPSRVQGVGRDGSLRSRFRSAWIGVVSVRLGSRGSASGCKKQGEQGAANKARLGQQYRSGLERTRVI
jgi:hypothetical protein